MRQLGILVWSAAVAACGQVKDTPTDGPTEPPPDAPAPPVKVTVLSALGDGMPDPTAQMIFQDPAGNVVFEGQVDAMGKLEAPLPTGGTVIAVRITTDTPAQLSAGITAIMGVKPGDDLTIGFKPPPTILNQGGQTTMTANFTPVAADVTHTFYTPCGSFITGGTSPVTLTFRDSCHGPTFDLVGVASGGTLMQPRFIRLTNVTYQAGGTFTIPGGFTTMNNFTVNAQNVPAEISSLTVRRASLMENAAVASQTVVATGTPPAGTVSMPYPQGVGTRSLVSLTTFHPNAVGSQIYTAHTATLTSSFDMDFGQLQVPWLINVAPTPTGVTWMTAVPGGTPDGTLTLWSGRWVDANQRTIITSWRIAHPPSEMGITLPRLSQKHAVIDPQAQDPGVPITLSTGGVLMVDYDVVNGYDGFRQQAETLFTSSSETMGAFVGMPFQRRIYSASFRGK